MATYRITAVHLEQSASGTHSHIAEVELNDTPSCRISRDTVIKDLRSVYGDRYITAANGTAAKVIVAGCPTCGYGDYITTEPDWTTENNLLKLPRF